jgi:uncharacterized protein
MRFKVNDIEDEGLVLDVPVAADWLEAACPDLEARPGPGGLNLRGRIDKQGGSDYLVRGTLRGALETACARCLEPARIDVDAELVVTFVERDDRDLELDDDDPDVVGFSGGVIDISDELRDEILLAVPVSALCSPSCQGLCPVCGGNRNLTPCDCEERQRQGESKFAALAKLKS